MPPNASTAKGYAAFFLNREMTALTFTVTVAGLDFTGSQTADPGDDLVAAHIHAPAPRGTNAGVRFGFFGQPFNDTNPNDVVVTPFASGVGGTITSKWDLTEGNNTTLAAPAAEHPGGPVVHQLPHRQVPRRRGPRADRGEPAGHRQHPQGVLLRPPQQLRHGLRSRGAATCGWRRTATTTFTELNRVEPGMNGGWIQVMGPLARIDQFKQIETTMFGGNLQQSRWPPTNIADTPEEALGRLVMLPGAHYSDPEFSWKFEVAPGGLGFMSGRALGPQYDGDLFVGAARPFLEGGFLWHFNLTGNRRKIGVDDPRLEDRVADNLTSPRRPTGQRPGYHREREPAVRPGLRRRHRHPDRAERQPVRRVALERRGLRDSSSVVTTNLFPSSSSPPPL